ncbi:MAG: hypothetical protein JSS43_22125 [Proteobacteria bacterium]|nr:hypothetical protein [Pseudomonadota bacterium]
MVEQRKFLHLLVPLGLRLAALLVAAILFLTVWEMPIASRPVARGPHVAPRAGADDSKDGTAVSAPARSYPAISEYPLFFPGRARWKPPPPPPPPPPVERPPPALNRYMLTGIVVSGESRTALIKTPNNQNTVLLKVGEHLDGWTLQDIHETHLLFTAGKATYEMKLPKPSEIRR